MKPLDLQHAAHYQRTTLILQRKGKGIPPGIKLVKLLGKGANNSVYLYKTRDDLYVVVRVPRSRSDTQRIGNATWEFRDTAIATEVGAAPVLYDAWYNRHATPDQRGGLHIVCAYYEKDVHSLLLDLTTKVIPISKELRRQTTMHLRNMAKTHLFCYDLKPANMVFNENPLDIRFIDFGRDFCEWRPYSQENEYIERAPVLSFLQTIADKNSTDRISGKELYEDLMFSVMVIILSANIAFTLEQSRSAIRCSFAERAILNFMGAAASDIYSCTSAMHIGLIQEVLRHREIRDTIRHYMGRRNAGTKRVFAYAGFSR